jgi:hypothetical protein
MAVPAVTGPRRLVGARTGQSAPTQTPPGPGWLGLFWRFEPSPEHRGCPQLVGFDPAGGGAVIARAKLLTFPAHTTDADLEVGAQIWSDYDEGAAALMAAAIEQETTMADKAKDSPTVDLLGALQDSIDRARASRPAEQVTTADAEPSPLEDSAPDTASLVEAIRVVLSKGGYQMPGDALPYLTQARAVAEVAEASVATRLERAELLEQMVTLQRTRMAEAVARWRAESPAERDLMWPDLGDLLTWLMAQADKNQQSANRWAKDAAWVCAWRDDAMEELEQQAPISHHHLTEKWAKSAEERREVGSNG